MEVMKELLPVLIPVLVIQFALVIYALVDLKKVKQVKFGNKTIWALIIIFANLFGPIIYLLVGRDPYGDGSNHQ